MLSRLLLSIVDFIIGKSGIALNDKKFIVTTTINPPTKALIKFSRFNDWKLIVVGDLKTPEKEFKSLKNCIYLNPNQQEKISKKLSDQIGWNCIREEILGLLCI